MEDLQLATAIGDAARKVRRARGHTQAEVAERTGISVEFYSRIERGITMPSVPTLVRLARVLGVSTDALVSDAPVTVNLPPVEPARRISASLRRVHRRLEHADVRTLDLVNLIVLELQRRR